MNMKVQNSIFLKKITSWYFRGMKTTTVPEIVFHIFIANNASLIEKCSPFLLRKQYLIDVKQKITKQSV